MTSHQLESAPYLQMNLAREHLDAVEALWLLRRDEPFSTGATRPSVESWSRRLEAHVRALAHMPEDAERESLLRLASPLYSTAFAGAYVLLRVAPSRCFDADGTLLLRSARPPALVEALQRSAVPLRPVIGDSAVVEATSARQDIPEGFLIAHLLAKEPRAGLVAASRARRVPPWAMARIRQLACARGASARKRWRPLALYAWGALDAHAHGSADPSFAATVDAVLGDDLFVEATGAAQELGDSASLVAMAITGHAATARRVARRVEAAGPSIDLIYALGLLGIPRYTRPLVGALGASDDAIRNEALRAIYFVTGHLFVSPSDDPIREDGSTLDPDIAAAECFFRDWSERDSLERFHLGASLRKNIEGAPPSFRFLRSLLTGEPRSLACEHLPGLFDGRPRMVASPFSIVPTRAWTPLRRRATVATSFTPRRPSPRAL